MARELLRRHAQGRLDVVLGRVSDYYGPRGLGSVAGQSLFGPAMTGGTVRVIGSADQPHSWSYLPDVGRALVQLADAPQASGAAWHLPADHPLTQRQRADAVARTAGHPSARVSVLPGPVHRGLALVHPMLRELRGTRYQFTAPFVVDARRFLTQIGPFTPTPHAEAITTTVAWYREQP